MHTHFPKTFAKALQQARLRASFTVEAAFVLPLFLFAALVVLGIFPVLKLQTQVNAGLQYAARMTASACHDEDGSALTTVVSVAEEQLLFRKYMNDHGYESSVLTNDLASIVLYDESSEEDYVTLVASYDAKLPIAFWKLSSLPVSQCVKMKKWTGDDPGDDGSEDAEYVYITPTGSAYHTSADCSYLKLSTRSVSFSEIDSLRNKSGGIYYPCSCYNGSSLVYVTDYGTEYHSDLNCSSLKRTIYKVNIDDVGDRHACSKCG
ncbi:MAG: pilus assembly protein [Clostridiales bacterium]|nr:pilus assembly protein [Clostridiales bacterium]